MGLRTIITAAAVTGLGLAMAAPAGAQEVLTKEDSTLELTISGLTSMGYVYRGEMFEAVFPRNAVPAGGRRTPKSETFTDLATSIFLDFTLKERVGVLVELTTGADPYAGEAHRFGDNFQQIEFEQVKVYAEDLLIDRLRMAVGVQRLKSDFRDKRGHGQFFLDIHNSENPFSGAVHNWSTTAGAANGIDPSASGAPRNAGATIANVSPYYNAGTGGAQPMTGDAGFSNAGWNPFLGGNAWVSNWAGQSKQSEFGGLVLDYAFGGESEDSNVVRAYLGTTFETGAARQDTQVFGADWTMNFVAPSGVRPQGSALAINYTYLSAGMPIGIHSFGLSLDLWLMKDYFEIYSEYVGQFGVYTDGSRPGVGSSHTSHSAYGIHAGGRMEIPLSDLGVSASTSAQNLFLDVSWWYLSGDDGDVLQDNEDFVSFESVESSLIIEGARYGFDIDTNYWAIKGEFGLRTEWGELSLFYGTYRLNERPINDGGAFKERLGNELDIRLRLFQPIENVEIAVAAAFLFDSNYFDSFVRFNSSNPARPDRAGTSEQMFVAEVKVKF